MSARVNVARSARPCGAAPRIESLEPRLMLSAELGVGLDLPRDTSHHTDLAHPLLETNTLAAWLPAGPTLAHAAPPAAFDLAALAGLDTHDHGTSARHELVFIDAGIKDYAQLRADIEQREDGVERTIVVLDKAADGLQQIDEVLRHSHDIDAVHVLAHGSRDGLLLGSTWLNAASLAEHADTVAAWQPAFSAQGDLLLYGCDLAASAAGRSLVQSLATLTGADVVASDDLTGSASLGGDWTLEFASGAIDAGLAIDFAAPAQWRGVLGQITVTTSADVLDGNTSSLSALTATPGADGFVSLREALLATNNTAGADTINLQAATYSLTRFTLDDTGGDLDIRDSLTLVGISPASTAVDGGNIYRVFEIHDDSAITVSMSNLKIQRGLANFLNAEDGGGLFVHGTSNTPNVYLNNVWFSGNKTVATNDEGGAIYNAGHLDIDGGLFDGNQSKKGGGIYNASGAVLNMSNVTLSGNQATAGDGGGFYNAGTATLNHLTITTNSASTLGGGVFDSGTLYLSNSILAGNTATSGGPDLSGALNGSDSNIFGSDSGGSGYDTSDRRNVNPNLSALADNGGALKSHAPQAGSQAIGNADITNTVSLDSRGFLRSDGSPDIGAHEVGASIAASGHYLDRFNTFTYSGNNGTLSWSNNWQEIGESNGPGAGNIKVQVGLGEQVLQIRSNGSGAWRQADLSGASQAFLSFDYARQNLSAGESVLVEASTDGGTLWTAVGRVDGPANDTSFRSATFNLSGHIDNDTRVRFIAVGLNPGSHVVLLDNIRIDMGAAAPNQQLTASNLTQTRTYTEGDASVAINDIVVTDADSGEIVTATLTLADINAGVVTTSGAATYTPATGVWTITGTVANVNTALAAVSFTPATNYDLDTTITVNIADGGENGTVAVTGTLTLDSTPVNDQLSASNLTQTRTYTEGAATVALNDIVVTDVDNGETVIATLTLADINAGALSTSGTATYTPATGVWTITGTVVNVNAALAAVSFTPATNFDLDTTIAVSIADGGENGTLAVTGTITLDVTPVNDQLSASNLTQTRSYSEGAASVPLNDIVISDVDSGETVTATLTLADINAGVLTTSGSASYTAATGVWTITGTIANVNAALAAVSFTPATNYDLDTSIAVTIADGGENGTVAVTGTITLDVTPVNDQLSATNLTQTRSYTEGAASVAINDIVVSDVDSTEIVTATLTLADVNAGVLTTSGTAIYTAATGVWTITNTVVNVNAALAAVSFTPATNYDLDTTISVSIADGGENATVAASGTITLDVTPVNDQLSASNRTQTRTYTEGAATVAINDLVVSDVDSGEIVTATLTLADINAGVLTTSGAATYSAVTGVWTITGTVANVNSALAAVSLTPATNYDLDTTIAVNIVDGGENATVAATGTITLDVTPVNDQLSASNRTQTRTYTEGAATVAINDIVVSDVDSGEIVTATLTLADINAGALTTSGTATYSAATGVWTVTGTVANVNSALAAVSFTPATNYDLDTTIAVNIVDGGENGTTARTGTITLDVTPVNDQLSASNLTHTRPYTEGAATLAINDIVVSDVDSTEIITATLTLADINAGVLTTSGAASYTSATGVWTITGTLANVNAALAAVSFSPASNVDLDTTISVNIADGGENGTLARTGIITLDVTPVNDQLSASNVNQTRAYTEGALSVAINDIVVTDVDSGETVTARLTLADINAGVLTTTGTASYTAGTGVWTITDTVANVNAALAAVSFSPAINYTLDTTISVNIADGGENGTLAVTGSIVLDIDAAPVNDQISATNLNQTRTYTEGAASVPLNAIVVSDADGTETVTATLTLADINAGVLTTSGGAVYSAGTGVWTITDTLANVNAALAAVSFSPASNYDLDTTINVSIADGGENGTVPVLGTVTLDVTAVNDQLSASNLIQTRTYTEGAATVALNDMVITDVDSGETVTATLTLADIYAGVLTTSGTATYNPGTGVWTITGTVVDVNVALAAVSLTPASNYDLDTSIAVNITDGGEDGTLAVTGTITLDVTPVNNQLSASNLAQTRSYSEDAATLALNDIVISDVDSSETVTATLTLADINAGVLTTSGSAVYTAGTGVWTITDTVVNVNAALAAVSFAPASNVDLDTTINVSIADGGENGTLPVTGTITLDVTAVNDQLSASNLTQTHGYTEGAATVALNDIVITDVDSGETVTATLTLADINAGVLTTSATATYNPGTGVWTITGTVADVNAALAAVSFIPATNYDLNTTIAVNIVDGGENSTVAVIGAITLEVTPINDQPSATNLIQTRSYSEGAATVPLNDIVISDVDSSETVTATLTLADVNAGVLTTSGTATFNPASGVWTITNTVVNVNAALAAVSFMPAANYDLDTSITVSIADGGEDGALAVTGTITLDVTPANDQLSATNLIQTRSYTEGAAAVALNDIVITDIDSAETVTANLSLVDSSAGVLTTSGAASFDAGTGLWTVTDSIANVNAALAAVSFIPAADYDLDTRIDVRIFDGGENGSVAATGTITLDVTPINDQITATNLNQSLLYSEGDAALDLGNIVVSDVDRNEIVTATLTLADINAGRLTTSGAATYNPASGVWTVTGSLANVNAALAAVSFTPATNYDLNTRIGVLISDAGENGTTAVTGTISLSVTAVNDQVSATPVSQSHTYSPGGAAVPLTNIVISDVDSAETVTASLSLVNVNVGTLTTSGSASYETTTGVWTITDTLSNVNAALAAVSFIPDAFNAVDTQIIFSVFDGGENATLTVGGVIDLHPAALNLQPAATGLTQSQVFVEDASGVALGNIVITDADSNEVVTATLSLADAQAGVLTTSGGAAFNANAGVWTMRGTVAEVNAALAAVTFTPAADYDHATRIAVRIADGGENGTTAVLGRIDLIATPVADTPQIQNITIAANEDNGLLVITPYAHDGPEVSHFRIGAISNGMLTLADGVTPIAEGDFITVAQGQRGLRYTPFANGATLGSVSASASEDGVTIAAQSALATAQITIVRVDDTAAEQERLGRAAADFAIAARAASQSVTAAGTPGDHSSPDDTSAEDQADGTREISRAGSDARAESASINDAGVSLIAAALPAADNNPSDGSSPARANTSVLDDKTVVSVDDDRPVSKSRGAVERVLQVMAQARALGNGLVRSVMVDATEVEADLAHQSAPTTTATLDTPQFRDELDSVRKDMNALAASQGTIVSSAAVASTGFTVGYVAWLTRGGLLMASMLSSLPAWRSLDPLPILAGLKQREGEAGDDDSLATLLDHQSSASQNDEPVALVSPDETTDALEPVAGHLPEVSEP